MNDTCKRCAFNEVAVKLVWGNWHLKNEIMTLDYDIPMKFYLLSWDPGGQVSAVYFVFITCGSHRADTIKRAEIRQKLYPFT